MPFRNGVSREMQDWAQARSCVYFRPLGDSEFSGIFIVMFIGLIPPGAQGRCENGMGRLQLNEQDILASLTGKQRQVLDLLIEHKTSKEIARILDISPHTVDQRIQFARDKLGAHSRSETAVIYRRLVETYGQLTYENSGIAEPDVDLHGHDGPQVSDNGTLQRTRARSVPSADTELDYAVVQELFEGRHATLIRLGTIMAIAVLLVILVLGGLTLLSELSRLMPGREG